MITLTKYDIKDLPPELFNLITKDWGDKDSMTKSAREWSNTKGIPATFSQIKYREERAKNTPEITAEMILGFIPMPIVKVVRPNRIGASDHIKKELATWPAILLQSISRRRLRVSL